MRRAHVAFGYLDREKRLHSLVFAFNISICSAVILSLNQPRAPDATQALSWVCKIQNLKKGKHAVVRVGLASVNERRERREKPAVK